jgi:hypothetical protein
MTTPWRELTLFGGWAKAQIPPPIESGVEASLAMPFVSIATSKPSVTVVLDRVPSGLSVYAVYSPYWHPVTGAYFPGEYRYPHQWFRGPFMERWKYTTQVSFHPVLCEIIKASAARRAAPTFRQRMYQASAMSTREQSGAPPHLRGHLRHLFVRWWYTLLVRFHPVLRELVKTYAARITPVVPTNPDTQAEKAPSESTG